MTRLGVLVIVGLALGCAAPISTQLREPPAPPTLRKLVIVPFTADSASGGSVSADAASVVTTRVLRAMTQESRFEIVPPDEAARVSGFAGSNGGAALRTHFGIDAVLGGVVRRYTERSGGPHGTNQPAAVWFSIELRTPDGGILWSGTYDETQQALSEAPGSFRRAWRRGFRWVTAADLAGYGARELARALVADTGAWN